MRNAKLYRIAGILSLVTIGYNLIEGVVSTLYGASDETLALFGFGVDSFVEVLSGVGVFHMIWRMKKNPIDKRDQFEVFALRITGFAFYILVVGLILGSILTVIFKAQPQTTMVGIIISSISIITMYFLYKTKLKVGRELQSQPIVSDANCTKTCFYLSFILLGSSVIYHFFNIPFIDTVGSLGIAYYAYREGREAFEKARSKSLSCGDQCCE
ncbi:MAG: cation transporter [Marinoscillum sp.]